MKTIRTPGRLFKAIRYSSKIQITTLDDKQSSNIQATRIERIPHFVAEVIGLHFVSYNNYHVMDSPHCIFHYAYNLFFTQYKFVLANIFIVSYYERTHFRYFFYSCLSFQGRFREDEEDPGGGSTEAGGGEGSDHEELRRPSEGAEEAAVEETMAEMHDHHAEPAEKGKRLQSLDATDGSLDALQVAPDDR